MLGSGTGEPGLPVNPQISHKTKKHVSFEMMTWALEENRTQRIKKTEMSTDSFSGIHKERIGLTNHGAMVQECSSSFKGYLLKNSQPPSHAPVSKP